MQKFTTSEITVLFEKVETNSDSLILLLPKKEQPAIENGKITTEEIWSGACRCRNRIIGVIVAGKSTAGLERDSWFYVNNLGYPDEFDDREMTRPKFYRRVSAAQKRADILNERGVPVGIPGHGNKIEWKVYIWMEPNANDKSLPKYQSMTGIQYPGNPRQ